MQIAFTKLTGDRHRLVIARADGSGESVELETRSCLRHDLVHYAVETEAPITDGFWGLLAAGVALAELSYGTGRSGSVAMGTTALTPGLGLAERLVGPMQSLVQGRLERARFIEHAAPIAPSIVSEAFVERVSARFDRLWGHWKATPFRVPMALRWPAEYDDELHSRT